jgi:FkbM family methyltransferase
MRHFIDLGTHKFEGLVDFIEKLNLNNNDSIYCYEPNIKIYELSKKILQEKKYENHFYSFNHLNLAVMDYSGKIKFYLHNGAWNNNKECYMDDYTYGSNCLDINPKYDCGNGCIFDILSQECNCIDIEEIVSSIVLNDNDAEIYIKCDIEGSEFVVLPKLISSKYINNVKTIYIEWHERFWHGTNEYQNKINQRRDIISNFDKLNIKTFVHS